MLNHFFGFSSYKTVVINFLILLLSYYQGTKLRICGLTGQISSGKTTVGKYLENKHLAKIINIDELNKEVLAEENVLKSIRKIFGDEVFNSTGQLDKLKLRQIIFANDGKRKKLEKITHMKVFIKTILIILKEKLLYGTKLVFIENAILLRFKFFIYLCFPIISICTHNQDLLLERIINRDGCSKEIAANILNKQFSLEDFQRKSDIVVYNDSTIEALYTQIDSIIQKLK
jgi:dephospho-CoA kinase